MKKLETFQIQGRSKIFLIFFSISCFGNYNVFLNWTGIFVRIFSKIKEEILKSFNKFHIPNRFRIDSALLFSLKTPHLALKSILLPTSSASESMPEMFFSATAARRKDIEKSVYLRSFNKYFHISGFKKLRLLPRVHTIPLFIYRQAFDGNCFWVLFSNPIQSRGLRAYHGIFHTFRFEEKKWKSEKTATRVEKKQRKI